MNTVELLEQCSKLAGKYEMTSQQSTSKCLNTSCIPGKIISSHKKGAAWFYHPLVVHCCYFVFVLCVCCV